MSVDPIEPIEEGMIMRGWHVVGDSHVGGFRRAADRGLIDLACATTEVPGATAVGLRNPNSQTDAIGTFKTVLGTSDRMICPVVHLGEVDCGFVIWYRAKKYGETIDDQMRQSIEAYWSFVDDLIGQTFVSVAISSASLPTIRDGQTWGDIANARRDVSASLLDRTRLTVEYNERLREQAVARSLPFIDISSKVLDQTTGVIAEAFRHPDPTDHHLDPDKVAPLWADELNRVSRRGDLGI